MHPISGLGMWIDADDVDLSGQPFDQPTITTTDVENTATGRCCCPDPLNHVVEIKRIAFLMLAQDPRP